jgi:hypothetical protein
VSAAVSARRALLLFREPTSHTHQKLNSLPREPGSGSGPKTACDGSGAQSEKASALQASEKDRTLEQKGPHHGDRIDADRDKDEDLKERMFHKFPHGLRAQIPVELLLLCRVFLVCSVDPHIAGLLSLE